MACLPLMFSQMPRKARHELFRRDLECLAYPQQRKQGAGPARLDHLPVADGEAQADHVLLAQLARQPVLADAMPQRAEEPRVTGRKLSTGTHGFILRNTRAKTPRAKLRIYAMILARINTYMPAVERARNRATGYRVHLSACCALTFALCFAFFPQLHGQSPVFAGAPDQVLTYIVSAHPELPVQTSYDIAIIETNAPAYLASSDKTQRSYRLNGLIWLESEQLKANPDLRCCWYEFVEAKAPALTRAEMDDIARDWWRANDFKAFKHGERGGLYSATFEEVRAHLQIFRTGNEAQVHAAKQWLMMAQAAGGWENLRIPPQMQGLSPLAHLLASDIAQEAGIYDGPEADKLRNTLKSLLVGKFTVTRDDGATLPVSILDVDALVDALLSKEGARRARAGETLEEWLKEAIDADFKRAAQDSRINRTAAPQ